MKCRLLRLTIVLTLFGTASDLAALTISGPGEALIYEHIILEASGCSDRVTWDLDEGGGRFDQGPAGEFVEAIWEIPGQKVVKAVCATGGSATKSVSVPVPIIEISGPSVGVVGEPVEFSATYSLCEPESTGWGWRPVLYLNADHDGRDTAEFAFDEPGQFTIEAKKHHCFTGTHTITIEEKGSGEEGEEGDEEGEEGDDGGPVVVDVDREFPGFFLDEPGGVRRPNRFRVEVDWKGTPGEVRFTRNGQNVANIEGTADGAIHIFRMERFDIGFGPNRIEVVAVNGEGLEGEPVVEEVYVFPNPDWLADLIEDDQGFLQGGVRGGELVYQISAQVPDPPLAEDGPIDIPKAVPIVGGKFGLTKTFVAVDGKVRSRGTGSFDIDGESGFVAAGSSLDVNAGGGGRFRIFQEEGLELTSASFNLQLAGVISREAGLVDIIPVLRRAESLPGIGNAIAEINEIAKLTTTLRPGLDFQSSFEQDRSGELVLDEATGALSLGLEAAITVPTDSLTLKAWLSGRGRLTLGTPEPLVREVDIEATVGASATIDLLFEVEEEWVRTFGCNWRAGGSVNCGARKSGWTVDPLRLATRDATVRPIRRNYERFGEVSTLQDRRIEDARSGERHLQKAGARTELVRNIFPGASPTYVALGQGAMVLWEQQDSDDPIHQSLEIAWSIDRGDGWSEPKLIGDDSRVELAPVAAVDREGRVVAAWLRIADAAYDGPLDNLSDIAEFHRQLEVVTAVFDPAAGTWSEVVALTDDRAADRGLRLSTDGEGGLLLSWLSNPDAELVSTAASPSALKASFWDAEASRWSLPETVAAGLVGASRHVSAMNAGEALLLLEHETANGDGTLDLFRWNGASWSGEESPFVGSGEDRLAQVAFDAEGAAHVTWLRDGALMHVSLDRFEPVIVDAESGSLGLFDAQLLASPEGHLVLVWPEVGRQGAADLVARTFDGDRGTWSEERPLIESGAEMREAQGAFDGDGVLHLAYVETQIERERRTIETDGVLHVVPDFPGEGRSDLRTLDYRLSRDLAIGDRDLVLAPRRPDPGEDARAELTIHNAGDFPVGGFDVELFAGERAEDGVLVASARIDELVTGGASVTVALPFTYPDSGGDLISIVDPAGEIDEQTETNNRARMLLTNEPPEAVAVASRTSGEAPLRVEFDASGSSDPEGQPLEFVWTFGDGSASARGRRVVHTFRKPGLHRVTVLVSDGDRSRPSVVEVEVEGAPEPPAGDWSSSPALPGFELKVGISGAGGSLLGSPEPACIPETVCVSGAVAGRSEVFLRVVGPKPNGFLWPTLVKFTTSTVEVWLRQIETGTVRYYRLEGARPGFDRLVGLFDRTGFEPTPGEAATVVASEAPAPPAGEGFSSEQFPDFRFHVQISSGGQTREVRQESACIEETLCFSGAIPGRSEIFVRIVGPKPNGRLWPTLVKFTTAEVEVWIEQLSTGETRYYHMEGAAPGKDELLGLFDREGFEP